MTADEACFLGTVEAAVASPDVARTLMTRVTATFDCLAPVSAAQALNHAFADLGRALTL